MDKMREEFELWYMELKCTHGVSEQDLAYEIEFDEKVGEYECANAEYAWRGWKASRAALCVELPKVIMAGEIDCDAHVFEVMDVIVELNDSGVSYKK